MVVQKEPSPRPGTREFAANDLQKLMGRSQEEFKVEEDMPPLLQVRKCEIFYQINLFLSQLLFTRCSNIV